MSLLSLLVFSVLFTQSPSLPPTQCGCFTLASPHCPQFHDGFRYCYSSAMSTWKTLLYFSRFSCVSFLREASPDFPRLLGRMPAKSTHCFVLHRLANFVALLNLSKLELGEARAASYSSLISNHPILF